MKRNAWFLLALVAILGLVLTVYGRSTFGGANPVLSAAPAVKEVSLIDLTQMRPPVTAATPTTEPIAAAEPAATIELTPVVESIDPLVFAVVGDSRRDTDLYMQLLDKVVENGNMFLVNTGDLVERGTKENFVAFQQLMADFPLPFYPVPGNHDMGSGGSLMHFLAFSGAPAAHYSFDVGTVHFTMANSSLGHLRREELHWIDRDLAATERPVKFVFLHHPPFDPDGTDHVLQSGNDAFMALMQQHEVDYVFAGHIHAYSQAVQNGTTYVISGGGGAPLYHKDHPSAFYHYIQVTVDGNQVRTEMVKVVP